MSYRLLTYDEILQAILTDYANQLPGADTSQGSDIYIKATAFASALWGQYQHQAYIARQIFPDLADTENLERHAATYGIYRKPASTDGADIESDAELLARLLDRIQYPPAGGNEHDYKRWAIEIPGITEAYVFPLRQGMGSITVVVLTSGTGAARIPGQALLDTVKTHIDELRPVCDQFLQVLAPDALGTDVEVQVKVMTGYAFTTVKPWVETAINGLLGGMEPLETLYLSKLQAVVADVEGVKDSVIVAPVSNVAAQDLGGVTIQMVTPGVITVTEMV